jgi:elongin-C
VEDGRGDLFQICSSRRPRSSSHAHARPSRSRELEDARARAMVKNTKFVTLVSAEGFEYVVRVAFASPDDRMNPRVDCPKERGDLIDPRGRGRRTSGYADPSVHPPRPSPFARAYTRTTDPRIRPAGRRPRQSSPIVPVRARLTHRATSSVSAKPTQVDYEAACVSNMIKNMMTSAGGFSELESNRVTFPEIKGAILERVCQYFYYKLRHTGSKEALPQFHLPPEQALELLLASNYLDC